MIGSLRTLEILMTTKPKILFYDIETKPLQAYIWSLGEQVVRHNQLMPQTPYTDIICIAYAWNDGEPAQVLGWGYDEQDSRPMTEAFDKLIKEADIVIGKNNTRFDDKHLNFHRMLHNRDGMFDWSFKSDDLERHLRKNFNMPSQSLDYISKLLGFGGKSPVGFDDWINIVEKKSKESYYKMLFYCAKDVEDTRAIWEYCYKHFKPKHSLRALQSKHAGLVDSFICDKCGSLNVKKNGTIISGGRLYQSFMCHDHRGYAGKALLSK